MEKTYLRSQSEYALVEYKLMKEKIMNDFNNSLKNMTLPAKSWDQFYPDYNPKLEEQKKEPIFFSTGPLMSTILG
jgi:hypothetical protein